MFRKVVVRLCVVLMLVGALVGVSAGSASADPYPWPHNGCMSAPDRPSGADFTYACNHHDGCYALHWANRATCDAWFRNDMVSACRQVPFEMAGGCVVTAGIYYGAVRIFGQVYYDSPSLSVRISTRMA